MTGWQLRTNEVDRERDSIYLAGQWKRDDDSLEVLVKYVNSNPGIQAITSWA